jgi:hypothetical protein
MAQRHIFLAVITSENLTVGTLLREGILNAFEKVV